MYAGVPTIAACLCGALQLTAAARCANRRFLVTLREPVARAVSSWQFKSRAGGGETRSFRRVVEEGAALARGMRACLRAHGGGDRAAVRACPIDRYLTPPPHGHHQQISLSHVGKGLYVYQLRAWFARVPRERFLVVPIEQFYANATDGLARVLAFVGVPALGARAAELLAVDRLQVAREQLHLWASGASDRRRVGRQRSGRGGRPHPLRCLGCGRTLARFARFVVSSSVLRSGFRLPIRTYSFDTAPEYGLYPRGASRPRCRPA